MFTNGNLALELDEFNQSVKRYIRGYGAAALEHYGIYHGIHRDEQLSTGWITGVSGEIENACEYDAFGNLLGNHEEVRNCILYGGQQYDTETGQYYLRARYYNPVIGRFIQEDPYRGDGLNLYAYCGNNPVVYYDPGGNECEYNTNSKENVQRENVTESETAVEISEIDFELLDNGNGMRDWMSPEEAQRYDNYWKQGAGSFRNIKTADGNRKEVIISSGEKINTRQRLQTAPGTGSIIDVKYSKETNDMYYRETIFDEYGRKIGTNDYTDHQRPDIPNHTIPHYHVNPPTNPSQHGGPHPGIHPDTPEN